MNIDVNIPTGTPINKAPIVAPKEATIIGNIPYLFALGIHCVPNMKSQKEYPSIMKGLNPL